jgi:formate/nitrite transporter
MITGVLDKKVSIPQMLKNWLFVYAGNCLGGILVALLVAQSGLLGSGANQLAAMTIKIAVGKVNLSFGHALILGVLCNWLVCLAVWMATAATDVAGKILAIFFPIMLFVTSGFEHSVANMCYIPLGIFAKLNSVYADAAMQLGVTQAQLDGLGFSGMFANNLLPVTIGNILGGSILVACVYWAVYMKKQGK